jgi:hypothetical protein
MVVLDVPFICGGIAVDFGVVCVYLIEFYRCSQLTLNHAIEVLLLRAGVHLLCQ